MQFDVLSLHSNVVFGKNKGYVSIYWPKLN